MANLVELEVNFPNSKSILSVYAERYNPYSLSRYKRKTIVLEDRFHYMTMLPEDMKIESDTHITYIVKGSDKNRLDIIAMRFYGDSTLYWVLAYFNNIIDPFDVPTGTVIEIPSKTALYASGGPLA